MRTKHAWSAGQCLGVGRPQGDIRPVTEAMPSQDEPAASDPRVSIPASRHAGTGNRIDAAVQPMGVSDGPLKNLNARSLSMR